MKTRSRSCHGIGLCPGSSSQSVSCNPGSCGKIVINACSLIVIFVKVSIVNPKVQNKPNKKQHINTIHIPKTTSSKAWKRLKLMEKDNKWKTRNNNNT